MRALVLSGGGARGAYHVGALTRLIRDEGARYDVVTGVSVGALIAAFLAQYPKTLGPVAVADVAELFLSLESEYVWRKWSLGYMSSLWKPSALNASPLRELVEVYVSPNTLRLSGIELRVGVVSLTTGRFEIFDQDSEFIREAVLASASVPGAFQPIEFDGQIWADGGIRRSAPLRAAIDAGADQIDVVICSPSNPGPAGDLRHTLHVAARAAEIVLDEVSDIESVRAHNRLIRAGVGDPGKHEVKLRIVRPLHSLGGSLLRFDPERAKEHAAHGYADAYNQS